MLRCMNSNSFTEGLGQIIVCMFGIAVILLLLKVCIALVAWL